MMVQGVTFYVCKGWRLAARHGMAVQLIARVAVCFQHSVMLPDIKSEAQRATSLGKIIGHLAVDDLHHDTLCTA